MVQQSTNEYVINCHFSKASKLMQQMVDDSVSKKRPPLPADEGKFCLETFHMCWKTYQHANPVVPIDVSIQFTTLR